MPVAIHDVESWNDAFASEHDIDAYYTRSSFLIRRIERRRLACIRQMVAARPEDRILEVGCGGGHVLQLFPESDLTGVDVSDRMLQKAQRNLKDYRVRLLKGELHELDLPDAGFDAIICSEVLEHAIDPERILGGIRRLLRPGGRAVITFPNDRLVNPLKGVIRASRLTALPPFRHIAWGGDDYHLHVWGIDEMRELLSRYFTITGELFAPHRSLPIRCCFLCVGRDRDDRPLPGQIPSIYCPGGCPDPLVWGRSPSGGDAVACVGCRKKFSVEDGVLLLDSAPCEGDFPAAAFDDFVKIESTHFWLRARNRIIREMLGKAKNADNPPLVLDVGCGTGTVSTWLQSLGYRTIGLDMHVEGLKYAARRCATLQVCCNGRTMPFRDAFDVVGLFDVIEHVDDDEELLRMCAKAVKPGGVLVVTAPADKRLWSPYDEALRHKRRYTRRQLISVVQRAGFVIERASYYNTLLWPAQFLVRCWQRFRAGAALPDLERIRRSQAPPPGPINAILGFIMSLEALWVRRVPGLFGGALIAVARRPTT